MQSTKNFRSAVQRVSEDISQSGVFTYWVYFKTSTLEISTASKETRLVVALENSQNGSGCANSFSLSLIYTPSIELTGDSTENGGINFVDFALLNCDRKCLLRYGYTTYSGDIISTNDYEGLITKYRVELRDASLFYTIEGFSSIVNNVNNSFASIPEQKGKKPTKVIEDVITQKLIDLGLDNSYEVYFDNMVLDSDIAVDIPEVSDVTLTQYISTVLEYAIKEGEENLDDITGLSKTVYSFYISDEKINGKNRIVIFSYNPSKPVNNIVSDITFNWMGGEERFVIDFQTEFNGIVLMSLDKGLTEKYSVDSSGALFRTTSLNTTLTAGDTAKADTMTESTTWSKEMADTSYKATLTTIGIPCEKPLGSVITVNPLIYGQTHITAGKYMVCKSYDRIDTGSFTTVMELIKLISIDTITGFSTSTKAAKTRTTRVRGQTEW